MITTALAVVVFTPRTHAGAAWAQTLAASFDETPSHTIERDAQGRIGYQEWRSGRKRAHVLYSKGKPMMEWRDDGERLYNFAGDAFAGSAVNGAPWGTISKSPGSIVLRDELPLGSPEALLKQPGVEVVSHEEASNGHLETYRLRMPRPYRKDKEERIVEVEPKGHRIVRLGYPGRKEGETIDYPASIPALVFEPRPQAIPGVLVFTEADEKRIQHDLRVGLAKNGPVTLRSVILTGDGALWAFWTGALPDSRLRHPFNAPGVRLGPAFTNRIFTTEWKSSPKMNGVPIATPGPRLGGMGRTPLVKLGSAVDLDVPYPGGVAHFHKVPIARVGLIQNVSAILGAKRDYR